MSGNTALRCLALVFALCTSLDAAAGDGPMPAVSSYRIDATFVPTSGTMEATAEVRFREGAPLPDPLVFYLHGELQVSSVRAAGSEMEFSGRPVLYTYDYSLVATRVEVARKGAPLRDGLTVHYAGSFNPSRARSESDYMRIDANGVLLRAYGYSLWFPVFLEDGVESAPVDFASVVLRTPPGFAAVFAGQRIREESSPGGWVSEWRAEGLDLFAAQCVARRFVVTRVGRAFLYHDADPASHVSAQRIAALTSKLEEAYRQRYRTDVPDAQVHVMQMPRYGDISSGNVVGLNAASWAGIEKDSRARRTLAHELVHPFVATGTPKADRLFALAVEGFPSYLHLPVLADLEGEASIDDLLRRIETTYMDRKSGKGSGRHAQPPEKPLLEIRPDEVGLYKDGFVLGDRALLFLNWLRRRMGKERFTDFTRDLFRARPLTEVRFRATVLRFLPGAEGDLDRWLETNDFPERFRLSAGP